MVTQYINITDGTPKNLVLCFAFSNYPAFVVFGFIIMYHVLLSTKQLSKVHYLFKMIAACFVKKKKLSQNRYQYGCNDSGDYTQAREPLLETT